MQSELAAERALRCLERDLRARCQDAPPSHHERGGVLERIYPSFLVGYVVVTNAKRGSDVIGCPRSALQRNSPPSPNRECFSPTGLCVGRGGPYKRVRWGPMPVPCWSGCSSLVFLQKRHSWNMTVLQPQTNKSRKPAQIILHPCSNFLESAQGLDSPHSSALRCTVWAPES